jgi:hypothetical protein
MNRKVVFLVTLASIMLFFAVLISAQDTPEYIGVKKCKMCHKGEKKGMIYETWEAQNHARATDAVIAEGEAENPLCLKCHSTGYGAGGYDPAAEDKDLFAGVQCEVCHGPGSLYKKMSVMKDQEASIAAGLIIPNEETCLQCHNNSHHEDMVFNFDEAWEIIKHETPEAPPEE